MAKLNLTNHADLFIKTMGKTFKVKSVCNSIEEANQVCADDPEVGVLSEDDQEHIYVAYLQAE